MSTRVRASLFTTQAADATRGGFASLPIELVGKILSELDTPPADYCTVPRSSCVCQAWSCLLRSTAAAAQPRRAAQVTERPDLARGRARARVEMGPHLQWHFVPQLAASSRAWCLVCHHVTQKGKLAMRLFADTPIVQYAGQSRWMHFACARNACLLLKPAPSSARKRKRTGLASGNVRCKLCKDLIGPTEAYAEVVPSRCLAPHKRTTPCLAHEECAKAVRSAYGFDDL